MAPSHNRLVIFLVLGTMSFMLILYDLAHHFTDNPSLTSHVLRRFKTVKNDSLASSPTESKRLSVDCCFGTFMQLLKGHNISRNAFFIEPRPPIPVSAVSSPCRQFLIPKPVEASRLKELVRCYLASNFVTYKTIGRVRRGLKIVKKIFDDNKVPLILCDGSIIGSHRYHGLIPYDDDFDFYIPADNRSFVKQQLTNLCKKDKSFGCKLNILPHLQLLIGIQNAKKQDYASFIDFFSYSKSNAFKKNSVESTMFPLVKRPLEGELYDAISNYPKYFKNNFRGPIDMCKSYGHYKQARVKGCKPTKCSDLNSFLPFVVVSETSVGRLEMGVNASHVRSLFFHRKSHGAFL